MLNAPLDLVRPRLFDVLICKYAGEEPIRKFDAVFRRKFQGLNGYRFKRLSHKSPFSQQSYRHAADVVE